MKCYLCEEEIEHNSDLVVVNENDNLVSLCYDCYIEYKKTTKSLLLKENTELKKELRIKNKAISQAFSVLEKIKKTFNLNIFK